MHAAYRGNTVNSPEAIRSANSNCFCCCSNLSASLTSSSLSPAFPFNAAATSRVCLPFTVSIHQPNCQSMGRPTATKFLHKKPTFPPQSASPSPPNTSLVKKEGKNTFASIGKILHIHKPVLLSTIIKEKHSHTHTQKHVHTHNALTLDERHWAIVTELKRQSVGFQSRQKCMRLVTTGEAYDTKKIWRSSRRRRRRKIAAATRCSESAATHRHGCHNVHRCGCSDVHSLPLLRKMETCIKMGLDKLVLVVQLLNCLGWPTCCFAN
jgi:hypothetical protein